MACKYPLVKWDEKKGRSLSLPCGKCPDCIRRRSAQWAFRLEKEAEVSTSALFITLTYSNEKVPIVMSTTKKPFPQLTLRPEDVTLFIKRLRKRTKEKIKYYYVGEYGTKTKRPHYHMLIFNADIEDIETEWKEGAVHYGTLTGASIGYSLKYMCKEGGIPMFQGDSRVPEFGRMSKGIGENYITPQSYEHHTDPNYILDRMHVAMNGLKISMPRYYRDKLYGEQDKLIIQHYGQQYSEYQKRLDLAVDPERMAEAEKAKWRKLFADKGKNKYI